MENQRLFLVLGLSLVVLLMWDAWQEDFGQPPPQQQVASPASAVPVPNAQQAPVSQGDAPQATTPTQAPSSVPSDVASVPDTAAIANTKPVSLGIAGLKSNQRIQITTDVLDVELDTRGADLREVSLLDYPISIDHKDKPTVLLRDKQPPLFVAQTGLLSASAPAPDHHAVFQAEKTDYILQPGDETLTVPMVWTSENGLIQVTKTYTFTRGSHLIHVDYLVENKSTEVWQGRQYRQLQRSSFADDGSIFIYTYTGGVIYSEEEKYEKISFDDMRDEDLGRTITGGWAAMIQHYFVSAWIPDQSETNYFYSKNAGDDKFILGMVAPDVVLQPGETIKIENELYVGPKEQIVLETLAPDLDLTVDYGFLTIIAKPLFWFLRWCHEMLGNWGIAIIIVTLCIKLAFFKLSAASYRSMANLRKLQPKVLALKERYGDDRQRMGEAMMKLYKEEKVNPFGGCLPILVQIPVFISLYWVLLESVELRQAPFILWIEDLSIKDPYYVLPLLMGITMYIQQKLNPAPPDPVQAKIMQALPFVFTLFFAFFPSGLVLYWVANNTLSIAQQWYITRKIEMGDDDPKPADKDKGKEKPKEKSKGKSKSKK